MGMKDDSEKNKKTYLKGSAIIMTSAVVSAIAGFSATIALAKKKDPHGFEQASNLMGESGSSLALRALARATGIAVLGFSGVTLLAALALGVRTPRQFTDRMHEIFPQRKDPPRSAGGNIQTWEQLSAYIRASSKKRGNED